MSWFIINNDGENVFFYDGSNAENNTEYSQNICLSAGCYAFEAIDSYGDGWNWGYAEITALNNDIDFSVPELVIQLNGGSLGYTVFQVNNSECIYNGLGVPI